MGALGTCGAMPSWEATSRARAAFVTLTVVGHFAFLSTLFSGRLPTWAVPLLSLGNVSLVTWAAFRRGRAALRPRRSAAIIASVATLPGIIAMAPEYVTASGVFDVVMATGVIVLAGCVLGGAAASVAVPLAVAIDRRRDEATVRRALDAWATIACMGAGLVLVLSGGLAPHTAKCVDIRSAVPSLTPVALGAIGGELIVAASLAIAAYVVATELRAHADASPPRWALVSKGDDASYRAARTVEAVARRADAAA